MGSKATTRELELPNVQTGEEGEEEEEEDDDEDEDGGGGGGEGAGTHGPDELMCC